ncbi:hypothetical protein PG987_015808 [Apiospora arundinis]
MNRLIANAIWLSYATTAACLAPEITADTNRDGNVDQSDRVANKGEWSAEQGAIFLPNIGDKNLRCARRDATGNPLSNDELAYCSDASGHLLLAPEFAAPLRTAAMSGLSENAVAHVYGTPRAAYERTRIFHLENAAQPNATESWRLVDQELSFNSSQLSAGLTLAIDGRELVKDASVWNGTVVVKFDVTDGADHAVDSVALKMAPVLTHHHLQHVETFLTTGANGSDPIQSEFVRQLDVARQAAGVTKPLLLFNQSDDIWAKTSSSPPTPACPVPRAPLRSASCCARRSRRARAAARCLSNCAAPESAATSPSAAPARDSAIARSTATETSRQFRHTPPETAPAGPLAHYYGQAL